MARKNFISNLIEPKKSDSLMFFVIGSMMAGFAFGVGSALANIVLKGSLKKVDKSTGILSPEIREQVDK